MKTSRLLKQEVLALDNLRGLVSVLQELAAQRVQASRDQLIKSRDFNVGLREIYSLVRNRVQTKSSGINLAILISSNHRLQGSVSQKVFADFVGEVVQSPDDIMILGQVGQSMFEQQFPQRKFSSVELIDHAPYIDKFADFLEGILKYDQIRIYHGLFVNIAFQKTGVSHLSIQESSTTVTGDQYTFEPKAEDLEKIFRQGLVHALIDNSFRESTLATQAARVLQLDQAIQQIDKKRQSTNIQEHMLTKHLKSKRQQARLARTLAR